MTDLGSQKPPRTPQDGAKIGPKNDQKSIPKTMRKKTRNKTKIAPSETQKALKNLRKINKNQKITCTHFDPIWAPKSTPNRTPKRPQNEEKNITKKEQKKGRKKRPTGLQNDLKMTPQNDTKTIKKTRRKKNSTKDAFEPSTCEKKPDLAVNGKRRIQTLFVM